jgi:hypothetical protein
MSAFKSLAVCAFLFLLATAAIPAGATTSTTIYACYIKTNGAVRIVPSGYTCLSTETAVSWNITGPAGPAGLTGPQGATGAQGPPVSFKSTWTSDTNYHVGDAVYLNGTSYIAMLASNGINPATDVSNSGGHWGILAAAGATGPAGPTGPTGQTGPTGPQGQTGQTGPAGPAGPGTFFSAQILVTPAILAYSSAQIGSSNTMLASPSFNGDPTFGETLPPLYLYSSMFMPTACTFDSLAINVSSLFYQPIGLGTGPITVTLMAQPPDTNTVTGPSATITEEDFFIFTLTATGTGSMAAPAGSYVWLQISGSGLTAFPTPGGVNSTPPGVIGVVSHCS